MKKKMEDFFQIFRASYNIWTLNRGRARGQKLRLKLKHVIIFLIGEMVTEVVLDT